MRRLITLLLPVVLIAIFAIDRDGKVVSSRTNHSPERIDINRLVDSKISDTPELTGSHRTASSVLLKDLDPLLLATLSDADRAELSEYLRILGKRKGGMISWCWSPETDEAKVAAFMEAERLLRPGKGEVLPLANQFLDGGRWRETATDGVTVARQGDPIVITWSLVPDGTAVPGTNMVADRGSDLRSWLAGIYGGSVRAPAEDQPWFALFEESFSLMAETCGVEFRYEPNDDGVTLGTGSQGVIGGRGDIRIGSRQLDGDGGLLGISLGPDEGDMVLDSSDGILALTSGNSLRLVNTLTHEIGHCLGLAHVCPVNQSKLMEPSLSTSFRGPQFDEFQSLQRLYGDSLEIDESSRDNDSVATAALVELIPGSMISIPRLSIDDDSDEDFYRLELLNGQQVQVEIIPGEGRYLEGGEFPQGCSVGSFFDSGLVHDLRIKIFDRDGVSVMESVDQAGPGINEQTSLIEVSRNGSYFVKVSGGLANAAQLYELRVRLDEQLPEARVVLGEPEVVAESGVIKNGRPDPGETVRVRIPVINEGLESTDLLATQTAVSSNVTLFSSNGSSILSGGETGEVELVFGADGVCGDQALIDLTVSDSSGELASGSYRFLLGELLAPVPLEEDFDVNSTLPESWTVIQTDSGVGWSTTTSRRDTLLRSAFTRGIGAVGESILTSPSFVLSASGGTLQFRHLYRTEVGFDGGVLEVSRNGGEWVDVLTSFGLSVSGGYDRNIREGFNSAIASQMAWTGRLTSFQTTSVTLPGAWGGETIQFRWRFVEDESGTSEGWWVDTIRFEMEIDECVDHRPGLSLYWVNGALDENNPSPGLQLELRSELPLLEAVSVPLLVDGSAGPGDYTGNLAVTLPAGGTSLSVLLQVVDDDLVEGTETLTIEVPPGLPDFAPVEPSRVIVEVQDRTSLEGWAMSFSVPVDVGGDQDGDGLTGLGEYLLGTDPTESGSGMVFQPVVRSDGVLFATGMLPERPDAILGVEASFDLFEWQPVSFETTAEGILVSRLAGESFLRLTFAREP